MADEGTRKKTVARFDYSDYERRCRDRRLNREMLAPYVEHFRGCRRVLDVACGAGLFMELLQEQGIAALGVERNAEVVRFVRDQGGSIIEADVFAFLAETSEMYDGIFCSHFIEHLPFERVLQLLEASIERLTPGGVLVLVFPNPESIRMQLFGFWRDPEHVRFYHPELIEAVCTHYGLTILSANWREAPFAVPPLPTPPEVQEPSPGLATVRQSHPLGVRDLVRTGYRKLLRFLRIASRGELEALEADVQRARILLPQELLDWTERANFAISRMWAWPDNATIVCRKPLDVGKEPMP